MNKYIQNYILMRNNKILLLLVLFTPFLKGQLGVKTEIPTSTLTVNGSIQGDFKEINTPSYTITDTDFYLNCTGTAPITITLPDISTFKEKPFGRVYKIKNVSTSPVTVITVNSDFIIGMNGGVNLTSCTISPNNYAEITLGMSGNNPVWVLSFAGRPEQQNVKIYGTQVKIPAHGLVGVNPDFDNHTITTYDTKDWWVISKVSYPVTLTPTLTTSSRMVVTYEYQGPMFDINHLYPTLTAGNDSNNPDILVPVVKNLENVDGKTRLTVSIGRLDKSENWGGTFLLNILLAKEY